MSEARPVRGYATTFQGSRFRSRLEARWAAMFTLLGWRYTYEPFDTTGYIPDFLIHGPASFLVEVGPCEFLSEFSEKAEKPLGLGRDRQVLVLGVDPLILEQGLPSTRPRAGYLTNDGLEGWESTAPARWAECRECHRLGVYHETGWFRLLPCGHHDGDNHLLAGDELAISRLWAEAGNRTQWRGPRAA